MLMKTMKISLVHRIFWVQVHTILLVNKIAYTVVEF